MARRPRRRTSVDPSIPSGVLLHVLNEYWSSFPALHRSQFGAIVTARAGEGFFVCAGVGCDMPVESLVRAGGGHLPGPSMTRSRCGETTCVWYSYRYRQEATGVTLGVRACADHVQMAREEGMWIRSVCSKDIFSVWEVMTG